MLACKALLFFSSMQLLHWGMAGRKPPQQDGGSLFPAAPLSTSREAENSLKHNSGSVWKRKANWSVCDIEMDRGDARCTGCHDALIIVDAQARLAPTSEKWDDKRGNFLFLSRWCVIVWATVRRGCRGEKLCKISPSPFLLTKALIHCNYTDGLKYIARQGITPIMQSWLKLGPHARLLEEHGGSQDVHCRRSEHPQKDQR